jgi:CheY-like chemotaxis protein
VDEPQRREKKAVLIIDNDERIQVLFQNLLQDLGFETRTTWSGYEALGLLETGGVDVLVVDDYVADLHVDDLLKRVGHFPIQPWIIVIQATAPSEKSIRQYALLGSLSVVRKHHVAEVCKAVSSCCIEDPLAKIRVN